MKTIVNTLIKSNRITQERLVFSRHIYRFSDTKGTVWKGVKRLAY